MKKTIIVLTAIVLVLSVSISAFAAESLRKQPKDQVVVEIVFNDAKEAELFKAAMIDTQRALANSYKDLILSTNDSDKKDYVLAKADKVQSVDVEALFSINKDGNYVYTVPYPSAEIEVGGKTLFADENGMLSLDKTLANKPATIAHEGFAIDSGNLDVRSDKNGSSTIVISRTIEELADGMMKMGEGMAVEGQGNVYRAKMAEGAKWAPGTGEGVSVIVLSTTAKKNIVGCNKLHKSYTANVSAAALLTGGSDCGISIRLGLLPIGYTWSDYCKDEALGGKDDSTAGRRFCTNNKSTVTTDGVSKQGHINCSWFPGVTCSEEGHTHT
jgi:hypothetical protein